MAKQLTLENNVEKQPLHVFTEKAYLDYSMYVILDRALPHIGDGLKPVQRRIVYAMSELGLKATAKYKKSARTVGDVLGKFHPHGDSACYEAMVLMAQPFSYRYPLVDGQGNWGSPDDPKSFAAMRYTESRLSAYADLLLKELGLGTVEWVPNFDGTLDEPALLPARVPNILLNGTSGIAVGMATDIPPHNLREVVSACLHLLKNPQATLSDITKLVPGPDFPTAAEIITPKKELKEIYKNGTGSVKMRAVYEVEDNDIIITALPHQVSGAKVLEQIAHQMQSRKLPMVSDLRDESDHENPTRLVIERRSNRVDVDELMSHLFATTDLEKNARVNLNMIGTNGRPKVKDLLTILKEWLSYREDTVTKRLQYRLDKVLARLHILDGLLIAYLNIDEIIKIIRNEDKPKPKLMSKFKLTDIQAEAILELKLRHLAKLEEINIKAEQKELKEEQATLEKLLASKTKLRKLIAEELTADAEQFGDDRRSPIVDRGEAKAMSETATIANDPVTVILSTKGWVRAAKGHDIDPTTLNYKSGDEFKTTAKGRSNQLVTFVDSTGRGYCLPAHTLPSARSQGEPLTGKLNPPSGATFAGALFGNDEQLVLLAANSGYGYISKLVDLQTKNKNGKAALKVPANGYALEPQLVTDLEMQYIAAVNNNGQLLLFPIADLPVLPKGKGNKIINIPGKKYTEGEEQMIAVAVLNETDSLEIHAGQRKTTLKPKDLAEYQGERGQRGKKLPRGYQKVDSIRVIEK